MKNYVNKHGGKSCGFKTSHATVWRTKSENTGQPTTQSKRMIKQRLRDEAKAVARTSCTRKKYMCAVASVPTCVDRTLRESQVLAYKLAELQHKYS